MDSRFIQEAVQKWLFECDHIYQACNFKGCGYAEADILAITRSLIVTEVEVKISRADYKADFKKDFKHEQLKNRISGSRLSIPQRFCYACPKDMINVFEVPEYAGLLWVDEAGNVSVEKGAPMLHKEKATEKLMIRLLENLTSKIVWRCQYMTEKSRRSAKLFQEAEAEKVETMKRFITPDNLIKRKNGIL